MSSRSRVSGLRWRARPAATFLSAARAAVALLATIALACFVIHWPGILLLRGRRLVESVDLAVKAIPDGGRIDAFTPRAKLAAECRGIYVESVNDSITWLESLLTNPKATAPGSPPRVIIIDRFAMEGWTW